MFYKDFRDEVDYYDHEDHAGFKIIGTALIFLLVIVLNMIVLNDLLSSKSTPYDGSILLMSITGMISIVLSYFSLSYLTNVALGTYDYLSGFSKPTEKEDFVSFKMETLFDVTLKNPIFYLISLSLGHFLGAIERHTYVKNIMDFQPWENLTNYFLTYVTYPIMIFFFGIILVTVAYAIITLLQKPIFYLVEKFQSANGTNTVVDFFLTIFYYAKKKSILMISFGLLPSFFFVLYFLDVASETMSLINWAVLYAKIVVFVYPIAVFCLLLMDSIKINKQKTEAKEKTEENEPMIDGETVKAKQTSYDTISPITFSDYVDEEVQQVINDINDIVSEVNPYLQLTDIEEAHVLKRITEQEVLNLIKHYNKLPNDTKKELKAELLERLNDAEKVAKEIAQISKEYHYDAFKKQAQLMDNRYNEKNAQ